MRNVLAKFLAFGLVLLAASPAFAQFSPGVTWAAFGGGEPWTPVCLVTNEIQGQLNLTGDQIAAVSKLADKYHDDIFAASRKGDMKKYRDLMQAASDEADKVLKPDQLARLKQIKLQAAGIYAFQKDDVAAALTLGDKQKMDIAAQIDKVRKDVKDLQVPVPNVPGLTVGGLDGFRKIHGLWKNAFDKTVNGLSKDQKKAWNDMIGEKFELPEPPR